MERGWRTQGKWRIAGLLALAAVGGLVSCERDALTPSSAADHEATIEVVTLHAATGEAFGVTSTVRFNEDASAGRVADDVTVRALSNAERQRLASTVARLGPRDPRAEPRIQLAPDTQKKGAGVSQHTIVANDKHGNKLKLVTIKFTDPRSGRSGLLGPSLLFRNGRLAATLSPIIGAAREERGLRIVSYEDDGRVRSVSELRASGFTNSTLGRIGSALWLLGPQPLHAQVHGEECVSNEMDMIFAGSAYLAAELAAVIACPATGGLGCPLALGALAGAAAWLTWTTTQYMDCLEENQLPSGGGYEPGIMGGGSFGACEVYYVEISYDGGATWELLDVIYVCEA
ncbi:MAG: hypothetical protein JW990_11435 [Thermoleophilia bacterium]|nr:hypothetical protein [Thermoleophilia bacterium]